MDQRNRPYYRQQYSDKRKKPNFKIDTRKRPLPDLEIHKNALNLRVVYPHTIFIVGIQNELDDPEVLKNNRNLGQFGKILECKVDQQIYERKKYMVHFSEIYQANLAFKSINLLSRQSKLRAFFSKNRFCIHFIRGNTCRKSDCPYIHEEIAKAYYFYKEDHYAEYFEDYLSEDILDQNFDKCMEDYWNQYRDRKRKQLGLKRQPRGKRVAEEQGQLESQGMPEVRESSTGKKGDKNGGEKLSNQKFDLEAEEEYQEDDVNLDEENPYFLNIREVMLELEMMRKEDFRVKEEQIDRELQEELQKQQKDESQIDSVEYRKLFDDYGIMMQPEPTLPFPTLQIGKETVGVLDEFAELQELILQQKQLDQNREKAKSVRVAFIRQLKKNMPRDEAQTTEIKPSHGSKGGEKTQAFDEQLRVNQENVKSIPFDIGKSLQKYNQLRDASKAKGYNSNRSQSDGESDFVMSRKSFKGSRQSKRSQKSFRSKSCEDLPNPDDIIQRNNKFLFDIDSSDKTSYSSIFSEESSLSSKHVLSTGSVSELLINSRNVSNPPSAKKRMRRLVKTRAIDSAGPEFEFFDEYHNMHWMISPSVAEAFLKLEVKSSEGQNVTHKKNFKGNQNTKQGKGGQNHKHVKLEAAQKDRKLRILDNKEYLYHVNLAKPNHDFNSPQEQTDEVQIQVDENERKPSEETEGENLQKNSDHEDAQNLGVILPKDNILTPIMSKKYFEASNTFNQLAGDSAADPRVKVEGSQDSEIKAKQNKNQKKLTIVESQEVSIFAGKAARKQNKKLKKKTKQAINKKKLVDTSVHSKSQNPSQEVVSKNRLNSISITTDRVNNQKDVTIESQVSQEDMTTMSQADEMVQDLKMLDTVKILRKQSDGLANFQKYDEKKELEKIQQANNPNSRVFEKENIVSSAEKQTSAQMTPKTEVAQGTNLKDEEIEEESEDDPTISSKDASKTVIDSTLPSDGAKKKRKRKKKKKSKTGKPEEVQTSNTKISDAKVSSVKTDPKIIQEPPQLTAQNSENLNLFLKEDNLDVLADKINSIVEECDPFEALFQILDGPFIETCHEIYLEKDEKKNKIVFIGDKRQFSAALFQKLYDSSGLVKDDQTSRHIQVSRLLPTDTDCTSSSASVQQKNQQNKKDNRNLPWKGVYQGPKKYRNDPRSYHQWKVITYVLKNSRIRCQ